MSDQVKVSVVIAAYRPGDAFDRVMASLDAQTLRQDRFEVIVIDDGSPDDTFDRLEALAATRPNMRIDRIENSGWPSRPRNVGTAMARGDYVLYMDHDDSLYPDALRRMVEYADETRADVLSPKESKTSDAWWGIPALEDGNIPNALADGGIDRLLPMVPHKLYRREFLREHDLAFPEGRRQLWEDIVLNVAAWRHADRVAVLADTPVYLWHSSTTNSSKTYGPRSAEFWDRLDDLLAFIDSTLDGPEHEAARRSALLHQYRSRVLTRLSRALGRASGEERVMAVQRARAIQDRWFPEAWDHHLGRQVRARSILLRQGRADLLETLWAIDEDTACHVTSARARWRDGRLALQLEARWRTKGGDPIGLVRRDGRLHRDLPPELRTALPSDVLDFTDTLDDLVLQVGLRDRRASVTWPVPLTQQVEWVDLPDGRVAPFLTADGELDPAAVAFGRPLAPSVHDFVAALRWDGASRAGSVRYDAHPAPATLPTGTAVLYASLRRTLALDASATLRNVLVDGLPRDPPSSGGAALDLALPAVEVFAPARLPAAARLRSIDGGAEHVLQAGFVADGGGARLRLDPADAIPAGVYDLALALDGGPFLGRRAVVLSEAGLTLQTEAQAAAARRASLPVRALRRVTAAARRFAGAARGV